VVPNAARATTAEVPPSVTDYSAEASIEHEVTAHPRPHSTYGGQGSEDFPSAALILRRTRRTKDSRMLS
jgi:hypothetical protein